MCGRDGICQLVTAVFFAMVCLAFNFSLLVIPWFTLTANVRANPNDSSFNPATVTRTTTYYLLQSCDGFAGSPQLTCTTYASVQPTFGTQFVLAARGGPAALAFLALSLPLYILLSISASMAASARRAGGAPKSSDGSQCGEGCFVGRAGNTAFSVVAFVLNFLGAVIGWAALGGYANSVASILINDRSSGFENINATVTALPGAVLAVFSLLASITALCCATVPFCCAPYNASSSTPGIPSVIIINPASASGQSLPQPAAFAASGSPPPPPPVQWKAVEDAQGRTYYYNAATNATSWTLPPGAALAPTPQQAATEAAATAATLWQGPPLPAVPDTAQ